MLKPLVIIGTLVSGLALAGLAFEPWEARALISGSEEFLQLSDRPRHRLVATLMCQEPTTAFLSVMSLHRTRPNPVAITATDAFSIQQTWIAAIVQPDHPLRLSCGDLPAEFAKEVPIVVHLDSRYPTSGILMHVISGSPIVELETEDLISARLQ